MENTRITEVFRREKHSLRRHKGEIMAELLHPVTILSKTLTQIASKPAF